MTQTIQVADLPERQQWICEKVVVDEKQAIKLVQPYDAMEAVWGLGTTAILGLIVGLMAGAWLGGRHGKRTDRAE